MPNSHVTGCIVGRVVRRAAKLSDARAVESQAFATDRFEPLSKRCRVERFHRQRNEPRDPRLELLEGATERRKPFLVGSPD